MSAVELYLRLGGATLVVLLPGVLLAWGLRLPGIASGFALALPGAGIIAVEALRAR